MEIQNFKGIAEPEIRAILENSSVAKIVNEKMGREKFMEAALQLIQQPGLSECSVESVIGGILKAAIFGFRISPELGQCWLVPRSIKIGEKDGKAIYSKVATFQIGYRGWQELAFRAGEVESFDRGVVREGDVFEFEQGTAPFLKFKPGSQQQRGKITHVWASATMRSGRVVFDVQPIEEVERHRRMSDTQTSWDNGKKTTSANPVGVWANHYEAMAVRVPMSYLCRLKLAKSEEIRNAIEADGGYTSVSNEGNIIEVGRSIVEDTAPVMLHEDYLLEIETAKSKEALKVLYEQRKNELTEDLRALYYQAIVQRANSL